MYAGGITRHGSPPFLVRPQSTGTSLLSASHRSSSEDSMSSVEVVQMVGRETSSRSIGRGREIAFRNQSTSNRYASATRKSTPCARAWYDTTLEELKAFVGILILMGIQRLPRLEMYWSNKISTNKYPYYIVHYAKSTI